MQALTSDLLERRTSVLKAIASAPRLTILDALCSGDLSVGELTTKVGNDISTVSRHLLVLKNAGIVSSSKDGPSVIYHLCTPCILDFLSCVDNVIHNSNIDV